MVSQLEGQVRPACEDGRDFILSVAQRVYDEPFPPYTGPKLSKSRQRQLQKDQRSSSEILSAEPVAQESSPRKAIDHYVMNLPDSAITFLDAFRGIFASDKSSDKGAGRTYSGVYGEDQMPMVHCHCFTRELEIERAEKDIRQVSSAWSWLTRLRCIDRNFSAEGGRKARRCAHERGVATLCAKSST